MTGDEAHLALLEFVMFGMREGPMLKPVCVKCQRFYRCVKTCYYFVEGMPAPDAPRDPEPGVAHPEHWMPYKLWAGDLFRCEGCGHEAIYGIARLPIKEHYEQGFAELVEQKRATLQVNDC